MLRNASHTEAATAPCRNRACAWFPSLHIEQHALQSDVAQRHGCIAKRSACRTNLFGILGTAHAKQHRVAFGREARFQAIKGFREKRTNQESRSISTDVSRIDPAAGKILDARSELAGLAREMEKGPRMESAVREMVCRRQAQHFRKLFGSAPNRPAPKQGSNHLGRRTRRQTHSYLPATASRSLPLRECLETERHQKGRSRHYLSPEYS